MVRRKKMRKWQQRSYEKFEMDFFVAFFSVRKLLESHKLSDDTIEMKMNLKVYPPKSKRGKLFNWHKLDDHFYMNRDNAVTKDLLFLCNQIVHSYIFVLSFDRADCLEGVFFTSDYQRNKSLYFIHIDKVVEICKKVGADYPNQMSSYFDHKKQDYVITHNCLKDNE